MKRNWALAFAIGLVASSSAFAQTKLTLAEERICGVNPNRTLFRNQKLEEVVLFFQAKPKPGGKIGADGVEIPEPKLKDYLDYFNTADKAQKEERKKDVKEYLDRNGRFVKPSEDVVAAMQERSKEQKLNWVGFEYSNDTPIAELFDAAAKVEKQLEKDRVKRGDVQSFLILRMGPVLYGLWKHPELRTGLRLFAIDDAASRQLQSDYVDRLEEKAKPIFAAAPGSGVRTSEMEKFIETCSVDLLSGSRERSQALQEIMAKAKRPDMKKMMQEYREWIESGVDAFRIQDKKVSDSILLQKGHGLIVMAKARGPGVAENLMDSCPSLKAKPKPDGKKK